jgi:hypothetical protein
MEHIAYELGKIIHDERLEEARRERLARSVRQKRHRRFAWMGRPRVPQLQVQEGTAARCVPCPSPSV